MSTTTLAVTIGAGLLVAAVAAFLIWRAWRVRADRVAAPPREDYSAGDPMPWDAHRDDDAPRVERSSPITPGPMADRRLPRPVPPLRRPTPRPSARRYGDDEWIGHPGSSPLSGYSYGAAGSQESESPRHDPSPDPSPSWGGYSGGGYSSGHSSGSHDSGSSGGSSYSGGSDSGGSSSGGGGGGE